MHPVLCVARLVAEYEDEDEDENTQMENNVTIKVTIWNEGRHEKVDPQVASIYPQGIHGAIAAGLRQALSRVALRRRSPPRFETNCIRVNACLFAV